MHDHLVVEPIKLTYEDFCALPDDGRRYEILDGESFMSPSPLTRHQRVVVRLLVLLSEHARSYGLGEVLVAPTDVVLDEHNIVEPDIIFVSKARSAIVTEKNIQGAPDLLVEVLSPGTALRDTREKRQIYARCGVDWYWIVDPDGPSILELRRSEAAYARVSEVSGSSPFRPGLFPGFEFKPADLA